MHPVLQEREARASRPVERDDLSVEHQGGLAESQIRILARGRRPAAEQASLCEVMAYVINTERPGRSEQIRLVLSQLADDRRRSTGILEQLRAAERAITQLWIVRIEAETPG